MIDLGWKWKLLELLEYRFYVKDVIFYVLCMAVVITCWRVITSIVAWIIKGFKKDK